MKQGSIRMQRVALSEDEIVEEFIQRTGAQQLPNPECKVPSRFSTGYGRSIFGNWSLKRFG